MGCVDGIIMEEIELTGLMSRQIFGYIWQACKILSFGTLCILIRNLGEMY